VRVVLEEHALDGDGQESGAVIGGKNDEDVLIPGAQTIGGRHEGTRTPARSIARANGKQDIAVVNPCDVPATGWINVRHLPSESA
jgi:hypothetical protein